MTTTPQRYLFANRSLFNGRWEYFTLTGNQFDGLFIATPQEADAIAERDKLSRVSPMDLLRMGVDWNQKPTPRR